MPDIKKALVVLEYDDGRHVFWEIPATFVHVEEPRREMRYERFLDYPGRMFPAGFDESRRANFEFTIAPFATIRRTHKDPGELPPLP